MNRRETITTLILDWLLIVPGVLGSVFCLITAFSLPASSELWYITLGAVTLFSIALGHKKRDRLTVPLLFTALVVPAYLFRVELIESFRNLWGVLAAAYVKGYDFFRDYIPKEATNKETVGMALLFLTALESFFCCLAVRVWKRTTPAALALLICIGPCYVLTDTPPDALPLLAAVFSVLTQAFSQSVRRRETGERFKAFSVAALLSAAVLGLMVLFFPQETYSPPISWEELSKKMDHWKQERNNRGNVNAGLTGNPSTVDLSGLGALPTKPYAVFFVTSSENSYLYLRGSSYTGFDGTVWSRDVSEPWGEEICFPYIGRAGTATLTVETIETEPLLYSTYYLTQMPEGGTQVSDAYLRNDSGTKRYTMPFIPDTDPKAADPRYDEWVRAHCLELPTRTAAGVLNWWSTQEASHTSVPDERNPDELQKYVETVATQVSKCAAYSRDPVHAPDDVDFCTWFLNDAKEGYCVHFASSCVALLRSLGIPARYVSGYVCNSTANKSTRVTNLQAHAWVEAWIGGRWVRVEPTPTDATEFTGSITQPSVAPTEDTFEPTEYTHRQTPPETRERVRPTRRTPSEAPSGENGAMPSGYGVGYDPNKKQEEVDMTLLYVFLGVILIPLLIVGRRQLKQKLWNRRFAKADYNERARLLYRQMLRLKKVGGGEIPEAAVSLVKKACFSQHTLTEDEISALIQVCSEQISRLCIAGFWKRNYCKYVLALF